MSNRPVLTIDGFLTCERIIGSNEIHGIQSWLIGIGQPTLTDAQAAVVLRFHLSNTLRAVATVLTGINEARLDCSEILEADSENIDEWIKTQPDTCLGSELPKHVVHGGS